MASAARRSFAAPSATSLKRANTRFSIDFMASRTELMSSLVTYVFGDGVSGEAGFALADALGSGLGADSSGGLDWWVADPNPLLCPDVPATVLACSHGSELAKPSSSEFSGGLAVAAS